MEPLKSLFAVVVCSGLAAPEAAAQGATQLVSVGASGVALPNPVSGIIDGFPAMSADGRWVAFHSYAPFVPGDTNQKLDIYVRDTRTGAFARVSVRSDGAEGNDARPAAWSGLYAAGSQTIFPSMSANGRFVVFESTFDNLDSFAPDTNGKFDVFLHDRDFDGNGTYDETFVGARSTVRISVRADGTSASVPGASTVFSSHAAVSDDGRFVGFTSSFADLVPGDTNAVFDVFVRDRDADVDGIMDEIGAGQSVTMRVSLTSTLAQATGVSGRPSLSSDGRFVLFSSEAQNLILPDLNGTNTDVYVRDRDLDGDGVFDETGPGEQALVRVSLSPAGAQPVGNVSACVPVRQFGLSADGRYALFRTRAQLVPGDTDSTSVWEWYVRDRDADADGVFDETGPGESDTLRVQYGDATAVVDPFASSPAAALSKNGRYVAVYAAPSNLAPGDTNGVPDVLLRDMNDPVGPLRRMSVDAASQQVGAGPNPLWGVIPDGVTVADTGAVGYVAWMPGLDPRWGNNDRDVFVTPLYPRLSATTSTPSVGTTVGLSLEAPQSPNATYLAACSLTYKPGVALPSARLLPTAVDDLFLLSQADPATFLNFAGTTDGNGVASSAGVAIPNLPILAGFTFYAAFAILDPAAPDGVADFSNAVSLTLAP